MGQSNENKKSIYSDPFDFLVIFLGKPNFNPAQLQANSGYGVGEIKQEKKSMAFVNEYVSEEDIKKYRLDEQYLKRHPEYKTIPSGFKPMWTIDRERNIHLKQTNRAHQAYVNESWIEFKLDWNDKIFICRLAYGQGRSSKFSEVPYIIVWNLVSIKPSDLHKIPQQQVIQVLKEALTVYGYEGARRQIPNTIVKFTF